MIKIFILILLFSFPVFSQINQINWDSIRAVTEKDYELMLEKLGISRDQLRHGPSGDPNSPDAANTDESKVSPYTLPDPLILNNGEKVVDEETWWEKRRPEIVELLDKEMYGYFPENIPNVAWEVVTTSEENYEGIPVIVKKLKGHVDNSVYPAIDVNIDLTLTTPAGIKDPVPVVLKFAFIMPPNVKLPDPPPGTPKEPDWKSLVLSKGWGFAAIIPINYQADWGAGLTEGIIGLTNKGEPRDTEDWGTLKAWAWGASRALDYFETDSLVNGKQVMLEGLSRFGKAALVTMAYDDRFALAFIGSSGAGGAKILRRNFGEQVENLASSFEYHWFAGNFIKYTSVLTVNDLPFDAHFLVALCAPRPVFISSGSQEVEGGWVDAKGMFLGGAYASPVYELLGKKGLGTYVFPPIETALLDGEIAFRQHTGGHTTGPNWPTFLKYAEKYLKK